MRSRRIDKKRFLRFILILIVLTALIIAIIASLFNQSGKTLKIGLVASSRPLTYVDDKKNVSGFESDYARLLAERLGKKPEFKIYKPEELADALESGAIDCVVSARQSVHDYMDKAFETVPFISYGLVFVKSPSDESFNGEDDLRDKRVGLIINSDAEQLSDELLERHSFNVRLYDLEEQPFHDLFLKKNDVVLADELFACYKQKESPESFQVVNVIYNPMEFGIRLSPKLTKQAAIDIDDAVDEMRSEVSVVDLFLRWFGSNLSF